MSYGLWAMSYEYSVHRLKPTAHSPQLRPHSLIALSGSRAATQAPPVPESHRYHD